MSTLRQAAQQALEALVEINKLSIGERAICLPGEIDTAMDALRAALAEPDSDYERGFVDGMNLQTKGSVDKAVNRMAKPITAAEMSTWVKDTWEKCQAEAWQEPVGHADLGINNIYIFSASEPRVVPAGRTPLYTAPIPRKPLTDEEMRECAQSMNAEPLAEGWPELIKFARAIERAHGIGGDE